MDSGFDALFAGLHDAAILVDPGSHRIRRANPAASHLLGYERDVLCALSARELHPHELPAVDAFFTKAMAQGRWWSRTLSCKARDGRLIPVEVRASRVALGENEGLLLVIRDLRADELIQIGQSLQKLMHDLRNTLSTSQLISDRLRDHGDPSVKRGADVISRSVERAVRMSGAILEDRNIDAPQPDPERFALLDVVEEVADAMPEAGVTGGAVLTTQEGGLVLDADYDQVYRIVLNLCRNAFDAGARRIAIVGRPDEPVPTFVVSDDGPGLPDSVRTRLFDDGEPGSTKGSSGLGLMIVRELARAHGGDLSLETTSPAGTSFRVTLPPSA